jgi:putative inorganic carbon (HCO3(-)) transporter
MMLWALILPWFFVGIQILPGLLMLVLIYRGIKEKKWPLKWHPWLSFVLIYLLIRLITTLLTPEPLRLRAIQSYINTEWPLFSLLFLTAITIEPEDLKRILHVLIFSAALAGFYSIIQFIYGFDIFTGNSMAPYGKFYRAAGSYGFYLSFAGNQLMALGIAMAFYFTERNWKKHKIFYALAMGLIIFSLLATFARSAWIALIVIAILAPLMVNKRLFSTNLGILLILATVVLILNPDIQNRFLSIFDTGQNATRFNLVRTSIAMVMDNPWTGIGSGMYGDLYPYYKHPGFYDTVCHSHNDHLQIAVISGFPGLIAWSALWISWFFFSINALIKSAVYSNRHRIVAGSILGFAGILIAAFFQCYYLDLKNCIFMTFILLIGINAFKGASINNVQIVSKTDPDTHHGS